jgi:hypothetical protein
VHGARPFRTPQSASQASHLAGGSHLDFEMWETMNLNRPFFVFLTNLIMVLD